MEEYNYKFSQNCSILTLNGVSSLVTKIRSLHKSTNQNEFNKHYKFLREHCISPKNSVAASAMLGLIELTKEPDEVVPLHTVVKDIMSTVPNVQNMCGIIDLIFHALFKHNKVPCYDIMKNQHPLITVLKKNQTYWPHILCRIEDKFKTESKSKVLQKLQPFALFVLYDYEQKMDQVLQLELLNICKLYLDNCFKQKIIILDLRHISRSLKYCKVLLQDVPQILTYVISAIYELLQHDQDATEPIWIFHQHLLRRPPRDYSLEIVMTADCLPIAPITCMETLCECLSIMLSTQKYSTLITSILKSCLLCWKMHFATAQMLNESVSGKIDAFLGKQFEHNDIDLPEFEYLDEKQFVYSYILSNEFSTECLDALSTSKPQILEMLFPFLLGLLHDDNETDVMLKVLKLCLRACKLQACYTTRMLPVLLHKLSTTVQPDLHLLLLRALPKMGVLKENLSTIVMTIKAISVTSKQMHAFAISLMYDLVLIDKICFPYLEELLAKDQEEKDAELVITKAFVVREMCRDITLHRLEVYRKELAGFVSKALMRTMDNNSVITFSFDSLKYLCHGFDPYTTMANLAQRFEKDDRERVVVGMCLIMGEIAYMSDISDQKCEDVVKKLFAYGDSHPTAAVLEAVYTSLSNFSMDNLAVGFPNLYMHITNDTSILGSLAGVCWVNLLQFGPKAGLRSAADMLIRFIHKTYRPAKVCKVPDGHREPLDMALTRDSILAAVAKFVRRHVTKLHSVDKDVFLECLRILSTKFVRPMPPMDWSFLNDLKEDKDMQQYIITIAARQSSVSESARRFIENYIKTLTDRNALNEEVFYVYNNLDILCNTIQPVILKPFFKKTIKLGVLLMDRSHKEIDFIVGQIKAMMKTPTSSDSNKASAAEVFIATFDSVDAESEAAVKLLSVVGCVPRQFFNDFSPVHFETVNDSIMLRCLSLHCATAVAEDEKPFSMLDNVIDCRILKSCVQPAFNCEKMYSKLKPVFEKHHNHQTLPSWLAELTSKINIELAEKKDMRNVIFASTVFVMAVVVSSGFHIFVQQPTSVEELSAPFAFGLGRLLNTAEFGPHISQILESMYDFATNPNYRRNVLSEQLARRFKHALLVMRSHENFNEKFCWMKYIDVTC